MSSRIAMTWWLTGLSGAGKSTLAQTLAQALRSRAESVCIVDGDELRSGLSQDLGFDDASRAENVRRAAHMARILNSNGIHAVVAMISPAAKERDAALALIGRDRCKEIYINTPLEICIQRDPKGLYARAEAGQLAQMTGIQSVYEEPKNPALRLDTSLTNLSAAVQQLLALAPRISSLTEPT